MSPSRLTPPTKPDAAPDAAHCPAGEADLPGLLSSHRQMQLPAFIPSYGDGRPLDVDPSPPRRRERHTRPQDGAGCTTCRRRFSQRRLAGGSLMAHKLACWTARSVLGPDVIHTRPSGGGSTAWWVGSLARRLRRSPRRWPSETVLHLRRPVSFDADAVAFCDSAQTAPLLQQRLRIRSTVDCPTPSALVIPSASFIPPSERDSSLISGMRTTVGVSRGPQPVTREWSPKRVAARYSTWRWSLLLRTIIGPGGCSTSRLRR